MRCTRHYYVVINFSSLTKHVINVVMKNNDFLRSLLKKRGIGNTMSKRLSYDELALLTSILNEKDLNQTTLVTLIVALLMLDRTDDEDNFLKFITNNPDFLDKCYHFILNKSATQTNFENIIANVVAHQNLTETECESAFNALLNSAVPEGLKAAFLEGLRLKEESPLENQFSANFFYTKTTRNQINRELLIDIANPYDGMLKNSLLSPFVAAILAACGYATIIHGVKSMGPKYGLSANQLLSSLDYPVEQSSESAMLALTNSNIGWAYIDQSTFCPDLYNLKQLRTNMIKRPVLATVEKALQPFKAKRNLLVTGYTHPAYKLKMKQLLMNQNCWDDFIIIRGVEGSAQAPLDRRSPIITPQSTDLKFTSPEDYNISQEESVTGILNEHELIKLGRSVLSGTKNKLYNNIFYQAAIILNSFGLSIGSDSDPVEGLSRLLDSGAALAHFDAAFEGKK